MGWEEKEVEAEIFYLVPLEILEGREHIQGATGILTRQGGRSGSPDLLRVIDATLI